MQERSFRESVNMKMKQNETREINEDSELINEQGLRCHRTEEIYHGTNTKLSFFFSFLLVKSISSLVLKLENLWSSLP